MKSKPILTTAYFPPVVWFAAVLAGNEILIESCETYSKQSYRNRCVILGPNSTQSLVVPVIKPSGNKSQSSAILISDGNWRTNHWRSIVTAYNKSPFFLYYRDQIENELFKPYERLFELNFALINLLVKYTGINTQISFTASFVKDYGNNCDLRNAIHPKKIFFDPVSFPPYTQVFPDKDGFIPNLSIIDLLFNQGPASISFLKPVAATLCRLFNLGCYPNKPVN